MKDKIEFSNFLVEKGKEYLIYGTGEIGRMTKRSIELIGAKADAFVCSKGYKKTDIICDLPVYELQELNEYSGNIILSVIGGGEQIKNELEKLGFNVFWLKEKKDILTIYSTFYRDYFNSKGVDLSVKNINLNNICFINPFLKDEAYALSFFLECGDLILPELYNDLSCVFEGPYCMENVMVSRDDVVFDCGSNIGLFSFINSNKAEKIYAFEPVPNTQENIKYMLKYYPNISIESYALGNSCGYVDFLMDDKNSESNKVIENAKIESIDKVSKVEIITLDEFVIKNKICKVDYIKADIEGFEREMLKGASKILREFAPKLSICEYHLPDDPDVLEKIILEANPNYVIKHKYMKLYAYVPRRNNEKE